MGMVHAKEIKPQNSANGLFQSFIGVECQKEKNHIVWVTIRGSDKKIVRHAELNISLYCLVRILCFQIMNVCDQFCGRNKAR